MCMFDYTDGCSVEEINILVVEVNIDTNRKNAILNVSDPSHGGTSQTF